MYHMSKLGWTHGERSQQQQEQNLYRNLTRGAKKKCVLQGIDTVNGGQSKAKMPVGWSAYGNQAVKDIGGQGHTTGDRNIDKIKMGERAFIYVQQGGKLGEKLVVKHSGQYQEGRKVIGNGQDKPVG